MVSSTPVDVGSIAREPFGSEQISLLVGLLGYIR
jgi:hypothetical protein